MQRRGPALWRPRSDMPPTYGYAPYQEDALQSALRLGGFSGQAALRRIAADRLAYSVPSGTPSGENTDTSGKPGGKSILGKIGAVLGSDQFRSVTAGLAQPIQVQDPLGNFARAATTGLGMRAAIKAKRAESELEARKEGRDVRRLGLEERRVAADELRASREPHGPQESSAVRNYEYLKAHGVSETEARDRAFGDVQRERATPQGDADVAAIASHYGVSPDTARVMKTSGATRIRPKKTTVLYTDPISGKELTRTIEVNEPIQLKTSRELLDQIAKANNATALDRIAAGEMPDDAPDDPELHAILAQAAAKRAAVLRRPVLSPREAQNQ